eukprot:5225905-Prymnesium_polylepis.2
MAAPPLAVRVGACRVGACPVWVCGTTIPAGRCCCCEGRPCRAWRVALAQMVLIKAQLKLGNVTKVWQAQRVAVGCSRRGTGAATHGR